MLIDQNAVKRRSNHLCFGALRLLLLVYNPRGFALYDCSYIQGAGFTTKVPHVYTSARTLSDKVLKAAATSANLDAYSAGKPADRGSKPGVKHTSFSTKTDLSKPEEDGTQVLKQQPA